MNADIRHQFDRMLASRFEALHLRRMSRGLYVQSENGVLWQGVLVTFNMRKGALVAQPGVAVFCPLVDSILAEYFRSVQNNNRYLSGFGKLGVPVLICPLYDLISRCKSSLRNPFSYSIETASRIEEAAQLVAEDFLKVRECFFHGAKTLEELRDRLKVDDSIGARMREIVVAYHLSGRKISGAEIERIVGLNPNEMTRKFVEYFKSEIGAEREI